MWLSEKDQAVPGKLPAAATEVSAPLLTLHGISKTFHQAELATTVLHNISLTVAPGDFIALTGSSGSGKSTLLYIIGLLEPASTGTYLLNGQNVLELDDKALSALRNRFVGFVFQNFYLVPYASALENVLLPGTYSQKAGLHFKERALFLLEQVGLADRAHYTPARLSGGQQQRVALARALLNSPEMLLADEPTGQLDSATSESIMELLTEINKSGTTIIMVTHSNETAACAKQRIELRDGVILNAKGSTAHKSGPDDLALPYTRGAALDGEFADITGAPEKTATDGV